MKKTLISKISIITLILVMMASILVACDFNSKDKGGDPTPDVHNHHNMQETSSHPHKSPYP